MAQDPLAATLEQVDGELSDLERRIAAREDLPLAPTVESALELVTRLIIACIADHGGKQAPGSEADVLAAFKVLVKGEPNWNAIRDNCRELVYYRNCIKMGRPDALPAAPEKMAVRTARHIYLYIKTRRIRESSKS